MQKCAVKVAYTFAIFVLKFKVFVSYSVFVSQPLVISICFLLVDFYLSRETRLYVPCLFTTSSSAGTKGVDRHPASRILGRNLSVKPFVITISPYCF